LTRLHILNYLCKLLETKIILNFLGIFGKVSVLFLQQFAPTGFMSFASRSDPAVKFKIDLREH